jgi:outer membrane putative beta-barrel porin/alpha-amylase
MREPVIARLVRVAAVVVVSLSPGVVLAQQIPLAPYQSTTRPDDPQRLQMPRRAPLTILPSITVSEEYNDNVNLSNANRTSDFITGITPALNIIYESSTYRLAAGYNFTAEMYARDPNRNAAFNRQNFDLDTMWRPTEQLTLALIDAFQFSTDTNLISPEGVATGRDQAWSNVLRGGIAYRFDPQTTLRGGASYTVLRYESPALQDSDVYTADIALDRALSRKLTGTVSYEAAYFDIEFEPPTWTHTPRLGFSYRVTETVTIAASAGPTFEMPETGRRDRITPAVTASYEQRILFGLIRAEFDRRVGTAGGLGGTTDDTRIGARVDVTTLTRGLTLSLAPRYNIVKSPDDDRRIDIQSFTVPLTATYRLTAWVAAVASYQFFRQRTDGGPVLNRAGLVVAEDADQNRIFVGLQFGYPFTFDRP